MGNCFFDGRAATLDPHPYYLPYRISDSIVEADPTAGYYRFDNADQSLAAFVFVSTMTENGMLLGNVLRSFKTGNFFYIRSPGGLYHIFRVTGAIIDNGTWLKIPIASEDSSANIPNNTLTHWVLWFPDTGGEGELITLCNRSEDEDTEALGNWKQVNAATGTPSTISLTTGIWTLHWQVELRNFLSGQSGECRCRNVTLGTPYDVGLSYIHDIFENFEEVWSTEKGHDCNIVIQPNGGSPQTFEIQFRAISGFPLYARRARMFAIKTG